MTPQPELPAHETIDKLLTSNGWLVCAAASVEREGRKRALTLLIESF